MSCTYTTGLSRSPSETQILKLQWETEKAQVGWLKGWVSQNSSPPKLPELQMADNERKGDKKEMSKWNMP
jgi:hypothetical protein